MTEEQIQKVLEMLRQRAESATTTAQESLSARVSEYQRGRADAYNSAAYIVEYVKNNH